MLPRTIALIGTLDTKGEEFAFLRDQIEKAGLRAVMIDVGVLGRPLSESECYQLLGYRESA